MSALPTGTITFLFTDIEGSTRQWEQMPEPMAAALAKHDEILQQAIEGHRGHVFKTVGDAFCAAFPKAADAVQASLEIHRRLSGHDFAPVQLRVRMALHSGTAEQRGEDYFGPTLNRTARILAVGHGSQILLSETCQSLVRDSLPAGCSLIGLGIHRLRDLGSPESIAQLARADLPAEFPPLKSLGARTSSLPLFLSRFIGRDRELEAVKAMARDSRLASLTGSGGCGKTRLATQAAAELVDHFPDGVWFVEFASLSEPSTVAPTIAETLSIPSNPKETPTQTISRVIGSQTMMLIFDNCEHLLDEASRVADALLKNCPNLHILATSREALGIDGERTYRVPSLQLPNLDQADAQSVRQFESVQLFIDRARLNDPEFDIDDATAKPLASICSRLDGIPLAIELAASRTRVMSIDQIEHNLDQRFRLLTGGSRAALPRQQTLRSLIDWSHDLLNDQEKTLFRRLSVFAGGWTMESAEAVCSGPDMESWEVMDLMSSLLDKNLATRIEGHSPDRYRYLETIRQYARDQLMASGEVAELRRRHLEFFSKRAVEIRPNSRQNIVPEENQALGEDQDNYEAAQDYAEGQAELADLALPLANCMAMHWWAIGRLRYAMHQLAVSVQFFSSPSHDRATALFQIARMHYLFGEYEQSVETATRALDVYKSIGDLEGVCASLNMRSNSLSAMDDPRQEDDLRQALDIAREHGFVRLESMIVSNLALKSFYSGQIHEARAGLQRALELVERDSDKPRLAICLNNLAEATAACGDIQEAKALFSRSIPLLKEWQGATGPATYAFDGIAQIALREGRHYEGVILISCARALRAKRGAFITPKELKQVETSLAQAREALTPEAFAAACDAGMEMGVEAGLVLAENLATSVPDTPTTP